MNLPHTGFMCLCLVLIRLTEADGYKRQWNTALFFSGHMGCILQVHVRQIMRRKAMRNSEK